MTKSILFSSFSAFLAVLGLSCNVWAIDTNSLSHDTTHTLELKPSSLSFQLAKITFLPDAAEDALDFGSARLPDDYNNDNCENYPLSFCPEGAECDQCPFDVSKYRVYSCASPYIQSGGNCVCPPTVDLNNPNDVCTQYCGNNCIAKTCTPTSNQSGCTNGTQNCDNGCGENTRQCCVPCTNKITTKPANSSYTYCSCTDDNGTKQIQTAWTCNSGYHEKNGACEKDCIVNSCSGYTLSSCPTNANCSECTIKAQNCDTDGTKYKITSCKNGTVTSCPGYTLSSCPSDKVCEQCTKIASDCSTNGTMYKAIGCKDNKKDTDTFWCNVPQTIDCTALGYTRSSGSCGSLTQIACPFDSSKVACIDFE